MEQTECSETSAYKIQTPGNYPEENIQHVEFHSKNAFQKLAHLVGFITGIYHNTWSHEHKINMKGYKQFKKKKARQ
jgi:hypothetical protein